jgi:UDP-N-acetylmuramate dehydrogenase
MEPRVMESFTLPGTACLIKPQLSLASFTSYKVGGAAEWFVTPRSLADLKASYAWAHQEGLPVTLLGAGSNLLISDQGLPGLVICTRYLRHTAFDETQGLITAGAGEPIVRLAWQAADRGWEGMEWAVGIPGTVGGAVYMNAGAHQLDTAGILDSAVVLNPDGSFTTLTNADLGFSYRTSVLQSDKRIVVEATFQLSPGADPDGVKARTDHHFQHRHKTQPYDQPSCGSVFRNPGPKTSGWLVENTGLKGYAIGGAQVSQLHANFILNTGNATANDIYHLIFAVQRQVWEKWGVHLEPEVLMLGEFEPELEDVLNAAA